MEAYRAAHEAGEKVFFMDYGVWSRSYLLGHFSAVVEAGVRERDELAPVAAMLMDELAGQAALQRRVELLRDR